MKKLNKQVGTILLVVALIFALNVPANAVSTAYQADINEQKIDELVTLAGKAARDGNLEKAYAYEEQIKALGTEILTYEEVKELTSELSGNIASPQATDVNPPPNSSGVHFYRSENNNYRYNNKYYDIITIRAASWDGTNDWLHTEGEIKTSSPTTYSIASALGTTVVKTILGGVASSLMTVSDIIQDANEATSECTNLSIDSKGGTCVYIIDMEVKFQWIRPHGNGDYILRVREAKYPEINYSVIVIAKIERKNGSIKTYTDSKDFDKSYTPTGYGGFSRVCQAYENGSIAEYRVPAFTIAIGTKSATISSMPLPPYMESL